MQFHQNLELLRKKTNETQKDIADVLNTTQQQYSKYEKGHQELPTRHLITLALHYNISTDEVIGLKNNTHITTSEEINILNLYNSLNDKRKGKAELFLEQLAEQQADENAKNQETA